MSSKSKMLWANALVGIILVINIIVIVIQDHVPILAFSRITLLIALLYLLNREV